MGTWFIGEGIQVGKKNWKKNYGNKEAYHSNYKHGIVIAPILPQPTRLTPQQLNEKRAKSLCYSCDSKYTKGHKCAEKKLLYIYCEEEEEKEQENSKEEHIQHESTLAKE